MPRQRSGTLPAVNTQSIHNVLRGAADSQRKMVWGTPGAISPAMTDRMLAAARRADAMVAGRLPSIGQP